MHELLAIVLHVVHTCAEHFVKDLENEHLSLTEVERTLLRELFDSKHVTADSYTIFCCIMRCMSAWYEFGGQSTAASPMQTTSPSASNNVVPVLPITMKLEHIQNQLLRKVDMELWQCLRQHDIEPQLYGMYVMNNEQYNVHNIMMPCSFFEVAGRDCFSVAKWTWIKCYSSGTLFSQMTP
jgi:hypothetical protein